MQAYPLKSITIEEAMHLQFKLVDTITTVFQGMDLLNRGDLGVNPELNQPQTTRKAEEVIAKFFDAEDACFVRGAGTAAIREALQSVFEENRVVLVHTAPIYSTTQTTLETLNAQIVTCDYNNPQEIQETLRKHPEITVVLVQLTRQQLQDSYESSEVIRVIQEINPKIRIVTDDNYAVCKVHHIGVQQGATLSCFSMFKLLGPEGIGCVVGQKEYISTIRQYHYSGGTQTQGWEALEALRGLVYAPVSLAIQAQQVEEIAKTLKHKAIKGIQDAVVVNAQSKVVCVRFEEPIAAQVLELAPQFGAAPYPIGAESKYEIAPMFYRVSKTMIDSDPEFSLYWIRINPMRSGSQTVIRILEETLKVVHACS